ncbi:4-diphosphocytidyl-2-C-methyl-D-erythritol kinase [Dyadobacter jejuensis]|uniref:4-diphosphocytidyl-2-C-methyl-D-erythritol kinase n=1 Tax=Dyadobacter jejuensis TaxID=1082580 RepID=A0A316ARZ7_9BACT|nr:4-(cytidine 5'-diphospho)-2-C-methyl-D-erythritol kinase [Dyadobacter jejuensis]PWJ60034.1 4-diphosphocytidyl-2-C-methyl-D-erythritol kinase [Dyadobacter jejuensis]
MVVFPNAKINIGLNIIGKRPDGFHNISSCFYPIGWTDALEVVPAEELVCHVAGIDVPGAEGDNLCLKAYRLLAKDYPLPTVALHLLKALPIGAGLGGGSADATFTLMALNQQFDLKLSEAQLADYARQLGSDCAFFVKNEPVYCYQKGDQFEPIALSLAGKWIVVVNPGIHISTAEAYAGIIAKEPAQDLRQSLIAPIEEWRYNVVNDFEGPLSAKYPAIGQIKNRLYESGALYASMTGSGSTVYGIFDQETDLMNSFVGLKQWHGVLK